MMQRQRVTLRAGLFCDIVRCSYAYCNGDKENWCDARKVYERCREYENAEEDRAKSEVMENASPD